MTNAYVELHCHSNFSLLDGASHPETLVERAFELGMSALALTDHDAVYGAVRFVEAARTCGIKPLLGAELTLESDHHLTLLVENEIGWGNLCYLISQGRANAPKGASLLPLSAFEGHTRGLIALSGCRQGEVAEAILRGDARAAAAAAAAGRYRDLFGADHFFVELQNHCLPGEDALIFKLATLARRLGIGCVATNNVHYAASEGHRLQDVLVAIRHGLTLEESSDLRRPNSEYYLKGPREMSALFADYPQAIANTLAIAERCAFDLRYGLQDLPAFPTPGGMDAASYLAALCREALPKRPAPVPQGHRRVGYSGSPVEVQERLDYELAVIERSGLSNYFLIVHDLVREARARGVRCQGRGSAANSLVAYLLNISPIDPIAHNLVFERFLSDERRVPPDIDIDFAGGDAREAVIQYVYERYGTEHASMACTFISYRARSALREVGKALGFPPQLLDGAAKALDTRSAEKVGVSEALREYLGTHAGSLPWQHLMALCKEISGFPRHLGIHNGGMIITGPPMADRLPTEPATMPGRIVTQWDKEGLESAGLVKIDLLGLRMLSAITDAVQLVEASTGVRLDLDNLTFDDTAVFGMIQDADTIGVFQLESRAQAQVLPRLRPKTFNDLVVSISLIRPGPIQGQMVHPYLRRRTGKEDVSYLHPLLEEPLKDSLGIVLWQEQVLRVAQAVGGFTPGMGERLRRALGAKNGEDAVAAFETAFLTGAESKGVPGDVAQAIFGKLKGFGSYSFPRSHAAAFAVIVYQSAYLKCYHAAAFLCGLLNNQPMGFWSSAVLVSDARRHGVVVLPPDVNASTARTTLEGGAVRLGLDYVASVGEANAHIVEEARCAGPFTSLADFCRRTRLSRLAVENLILSGAMDEWGRPRRDLLWELGALSYGPGELGLVFGDEGVSLPSLTGAEKMQSEYSVLGLSVGNHPLALHRPSLSVQGILDSRDLAKCPSGVQVKVAGLLVIHQAPPSAKGVHFLTLEDEQNLMNVILWPDVYAAHRRELRESPLLLVEGKVQRTDGVINVIASRVGALPGLEQPYSGLQVD